MKTTGEKIKVRVCSDCGKNLISPNAIRCRVCAGRNTQRKFGRIVDRTDMLEMLESGRYTLVEVGIKFGVTRERVRQVWKNNMNNMGVGYKKHRQFLGVLRDEKEQKYLDSFSYICLQCKKEVTHREKYGWVYCKSCRESLLHTSRRNYRVIRVCPTCNKEFSPWNNYSAPSLSGRRTGRFCSIDCYVKSPQFRDMQHNRNKKFTRENIIDLVCEFITKNGRIPKWKEFSKKGLGVSNGTIYKYFPSVGELWKEAYLKLEDKGGEK